MATFLMWLPDSFMVVGIIAIAFGLILGFITIRRALSLLGLVVLLLSSGPFVDALFDYLWRVTPIWLLVPLILICLLGMLRFLIQLVIGKGAADEMIGNLAASIVRGTFYAFCRILILPFRLLMAKAKS